MTMQNLGPNKLDNYNSTLEKFPNNGLTTNEEYINKNYLNGAYVLEVKPGDRQPSKPLEFKYDQYGIMAGLISSINQASMSMDGNYLFAITNNMDNFNSQILVFDYQTQVLINKQSLQANKVLDIKTYNDEIYLLTHQNNDNLDINSNQNSNAFLQILKWHQNGLNITLIKTIDLQNKYCTSMTKGSDQEYQFIYIQCRYNLTQIFFKRTQLAKYNIITNQKVLSYNHEIKLNGQTYIEYHYPTGDIWHSANQQFHRVLPNFSRNTSQSINNFGENAICRFDKQGKKLITMSSNSRYSIFENYYNDFENYHNDTSKFFDDLIFTALDLTIYGSVQNIMMSDDGSTFLAFFKKGYVVKRTTSNPGKNIYVKEMGLNNLQKVEILQSQNDNCLIYNQQNSMCEVCDYGYQTHPSLFCNYCQTPNKCCKSNQYQSIVTQTCHDCHETCQECDQEGETGCIFCKFGLFYNPIIKKCQSICPSYHYENLVDRTCEYEKLENLDYCKVFGK